MKKLIIGKTIFLIATLLLIAAVANARDISSVRHHKRCKGLSKAMLQPKNNWKSYVRYR